MNLLLAALPPLFMAFVALAAVWSWGGMKYRWTVYFSALLGMVLTVCAYVDIIGHPSPLRPKGKVIAYVLDEPRAIYVWLQVEGKPYAVQLPWSIQQAQQLIKQKKIEESGSHFVFDGGEFQEVPATPDPPK